MDNIEGEPPCKMIRTELKNSTIDTMRYIDVGIEEFLNKNGLGFTGKIKERWEDFIVNEIDLNGTLVSLTSTELPESKNKSTEFENKHLTDSVIIDLDNISSEFDKKEIIFDAPEDKMTRTEIYNFIKFKYPKLSGNTEMRNNKRVFVITNVADERSKIAKKIAKMNGEDDYCQFVLYKEGKDTFTAVNLISKYLKIKPGNFTYSGTKDRRGITSQLVTVKSCAANRLKGLNKCLNGINLGNFQYVPKPLKLGDLYGNRFKLVIREVSGSDFEIEAAIERFKKGFINYFGLQRFGSTDIRSHEIGKLALASNWEGMIKLILEPTAQDLPFMRECKKKFKENLDCDEFLNSCSSGIEQSIIVGVTKHGFTLNAIENLPRNLRQLYVHSFQSYVWNKIVSKRIRELGNQLVLPGDLLEQGDTIKESQIDQYSVYDLVLPLPGYDIKLPENQLADWYQEMLALDHLSMGKLKHRVKDFSLPGSYRKMIAVPENVQYSIVNYTDSSIPLIESDRQRMENNFVSVQSEGPLKAIVIEFTLPKSAYATIAIRELMKTVQVIQ